MTTIANKKYTGIVKWFDSRGGFGFITMLGGGNDIFVHYSALTTTLDSQYRYLVLGEYVEFVLEKADNEKYEFHAKDVSGIQGGNLMCESRKLFSLENNKLKGKTEGHTNEGHTSEGQLDTEEKTMEQEERRRKRPAIGRNRRVYPTKKY